MHGDDRLNESTGRGIITHGGRNERHAGRTGEVQNQVRGERKTDNVEPEHCE